MRFEKRALGEIEKCYATLGVMVGGAPWLYYAGEGNGSLQVFHGDGFSERETIWEGGGGTMSIVAAPGHSDDGWVFASRGFYSMVDSKDSTIELIRRADGAFSYATVAHLPYLHRFGVVTAPDGANWLLAATLHSFKSDKEDWSHPGYLYVARLPDDLNDPFTAELERLPGDFYMNHGFCTADGRGYTSSKEGVFRLTPPVGDGAWRVERLLDMPVSDVAVGDIDGDGEEELCVIFPFHGDRFAVYKRSDALLSEVYQYPVPNDFYHAVIYARMAGEGVFVGGARKLTADLFVVRWDAARGAFDALQIDAGPGPSNVAVLNAPDADYLLSANRMVAQAAVYVRKDDGITL